MSDRPFSLLTRRRVLGLTLSGGALLGGGVGGALFLRGGAAEVSGLKVLSAHGYRTMARLAEWAVEKKLIDGVAYWDQVEAGLKKRLALGEKDELGWVSASRYRRVTPSEAGLAPGDGFPPTCVMPHGVDWASASTTPSSST